jgi:hypothetical protein
MSAKPKAWTLTKDSEVNRDVKAGATVYDCWGCDYGIASDDTRLLGYECVSVTLDPEGGYPFFTVPKRDLEAQAA